MSTVSVVLYSPGWERGHGRRCHNRFGAPVGNRVEGAHAFGDRVTGFARAVDDLVQLQVQVSEVGSDQVPVGLFALKMQLDEINENLL